MYRLLHREKELLAIFKFADHDAQIHHGNAAEIVER